MKPKQLIITKTNQPDLHKYLVNRFLQLGFSLYSSNFKIEVIDDIEELVENKRNEHQSA